MLKDAEHLLEIKWGKKTLQAAEDGFLLGEQGAYCREQTAFSKLHQYSSAHSLCSLHFWLMG